MRQLISKFVRDARGATSIEYALIAGTTCLAIVITLPTVRDGLATAYASVKDALVASR